MMRWAVVLWIALLLWLPQPGDAKCACGGMTRDEEEPMQAGEARAERDTGQAEEARTERDTGQAEEARAERETGAHTGDDAEAVRRRVVMVPIAAGAFHMGSANAPYAEDGEGPVRAARVARPFAVDATEVTVEQFAAFARATGYRSDAERFGWSFVFEGLLGAAGLREDDKVVANARWWVRVAKAHWALPLGDRVSPAQQGSVEQRAREPAIHMSWNDAWALCQWRGARLCTETEWELAARGGLHQKTYPWGDDFVPTPGKFKANIWTGTFPTLNSRADGYVGVSPVMSYEPNAFGLYDVVGNVWEWVADPFRGANHSAAYDAPPPPPITVHTDFKTQRGGSHMCHRSYCFRYRVSSRTGSAGDSSSSNMGFRCCRSLEATPDETTEL